MEIVQTGEKKKMVISLSRDILNICSHTKYQFNDTVEEEARDILGKGKNNTFF